MGRWWIATTRQVRLWRGWLALAGWAACPPAAWALEQVTLQLKWTHAFQFAGYYAAVERGYYRDAGLDVHLQEAVPGVDPVAAVVSRQAEYGVGTSSLLLARKAGQPVVVVAVIFQHSPLVLIARQVPGNDGTQGLHDIIGRRVMLEPQSDELTAYLRREGIRTEQLQMLSHSFQPQDLIDGKVDAISAYVSNEPFYLDRAGLQYQVHTPRASGIDFYGDNLFTSEQELRDHPDRVRAFRRASLEGWRYALQHPEEIADLIVQRYSSRHPREFYLYEARKMEPLLRADLIELGYMYRGRWRDIADTYAELGLLPDHQSLDGFLYEPDQPPDYTRLYVATALLAVVSVTAGYIFRVNRRLARALSESQAAEQRIRHLAQHDPLTDLPNRTLFSDRLNRALASARRHRQSLVVIFLDLDHFKPINDQFGHGVGDQLLCQVALRLRQCLRESDTLARVGGDEFVILLPQSSLSQTAMRVADKLIAALAPPFEVQGRHLSISVSIGMAGFPEHGSDEVELVRHADQAMYLAKRAGRSAVKIYTGAAMPDHGADEPAP